MESRLKNLYEYLIENRKHEVAGWHKAYEDFFGQVKVVRDSLVQGRLVQEEEGLSKMNKTFLRQLLYDKDNGIASRGQSVLSEENFSLVIKDNQYLDKLKELIINPSTKSHEEFSRIWKEKVGKENPVLINRVAAACTLDVSTTVDSGKFKKVFNWFVSEGIIRKYESEPDWFSKNVYLMKLIKEEFAAELKREETDMFYLSIFVWVLYENLLNPFSLNKQVVKYGAPGTGKTYQARQQSSLLFNIWKREFNPDSKQHDEEQIELVQFHPSYTYEDFMEGLRPMLDDENNAQLSLQNGVFKKFCRNAGKWEIDVFGLSRDPDFDLDWETIKIEDLDPHREKLSGDHWEYIFNINDKSKLVSDAVPPFFFIIDEVNRADLSRVFGELMYCLEYRGIKGRIKTQYANLNNESTGMLKIDQGYQFFIPSNIYLIGTMNTIDRSVESFDFALRRRFRWEEVPPDTGLLRYHLNQFCKTWVDLADNLEKLNTEIADEPLLGRDYQIGHAYLMNLMYDKELTVSEVREGVWEDCIRPLLQEYLRGTGKESELIGSQDKDGVFKKSFGMK